MSDGAARPIGFGNALLEQVRWCWQRLWLSIVLIAAVTAGGTAWIMSRVQQAEQEVAFFLIMSHAFHPVLLLIAISWSMSVWRDDPPKDRQYFWLHPVSRTPHTIARSLAGGFWLLAAVAFIVGVVVVSMKLTQSDAFIGTGPFWLYVLGGVVLAYVAASIAPVLSNKPGPWFIAVLVVVIVAETIAVIRQIEWLESVVRVFKGGRYSFTAALAGPRVEAGRALSQRMETPGSGAAQDAVTRAAEADPATALLIWIPVALVLYYVAARLSRPR